MKDKGEKRTGQAAPPPSGGAGRRERTEPGKRKKREPGEPIEHGPTQRETTTAPVSGGAMSGTGASVRSRSHSGTTTTPGAGPNPNPIVSPDGDER